MSRNDLIRRGDAYEAIYALHADGVEGIVNAPRNSYGEDLRDVLDAISDIPAVPHEMTAREYLMVRTRMCYKYESCEGCPLNIINEKYNCLCFSVESQSQEEAVAIVEEWAREHPEKRSE